MARRTRKAILAELNAPLPPVGETLAMLEALETRQYETKARTRAALKLAHRTLGALLSSIDASVRHPSLISRAKAESLHRDLRRYMKLDEPKRFPSLPRLAPPSPPQPPRELAASAISSPAALPVDRAMELFGDEGLEFDSEAG